jgi:hypothetical protein
MAAALGRLSRVRRLKKAAKERSSDLFRRGMQSLDEEDGVLTEQGAHVASDFQDWSITGDVDWSAFGFDSDFGDLGPLVAGSRTPPVSGERSAGVS